MKISDLLATSLGSELYNIKICDLSMRVMATGKWNMLQSFSVRLMRKMEALGIPCTWYSGDNAVSSFIMDVHNLQGIPFTGLLLYLPDQIDENELNELSYALALSRIKGACVCLFKETPFTDYLAWRKVLDKCNSFVCLSADEEDDGFLAMNSIKKEQNNLVAVDLLSDRRMQQYKEANKENDIREENSLIQEPPGCSRAKKKNNRDPFFQIKNPPMLNLIGILFIFTALLLVAPGDSSKLNISISFREFLLLLLYPASLEPDVLSGINTRLLYGLTVLLAPIIFGISGLIAGLGAFVEKIILRNPTKSKLHDVLYGAGGIILLFLLFYPVGLIWFSWPFTWIERIMALMIYAVSLVITIETINVA